MHTDLHVPLVRDTTSRSWFTTLSNGGRKRRSRSSVISDSFHFRMRTKREPKDIVLTSIGILARCDVERPFRDGTAPDIVLVT